MKPRNLVFYILPPLLASLFLLHCGGQNDKLANGTDLKPWLWLNGKFIGHQIVYDRNGNVKGTAQINRSCKPESQIRGSCKDQIISHIFVSAENRFEISNITSNMTWDFTFTDTGALTAVVKDGRGVLTGTSELGLMLLEGEQGLPGDKATNPKKAKVKVRFQGLPYPPGAVLQNEEYQFLWFRLGTTRTIWLKQKPNQAK